MTYLFNTPLYLFEIILKIEIAKLGKYNDMNYINYDCDHNCTCVAISKIIQKMQ